MDTQDFNNSFLWSSLLVILYILSILSILLFLFYSHAAVGGKTAVDRDHHASDELRGR